MNEVNILTTHQIQMLEPMSTKRIEVGRCSKVNSVKQMFFFTMHVTLTGNQNDVLEIHAHYLS